MTSNFKQAAFALTAALVALTGCEQVIDLELDENQTLPVFSFRYNATTDQVVGTINESVDFYSPTVPALETSAAVEFIAPDGSTTAISPVAELYLGNVDAAPATGDTVGLRVVRNGLEYVAFNDVPDSLALDSAIVREFEGFPFGPPQDSLEGPQYEVYIYFPATEEPRNVFVEFLVDGELQSDILQGLKTTPGELTEIPLGWSQRLFNPGEVVEIWVWTVSDDTYDYWLALSSILGAFGPNGVPGNPPSHWSGEALGHFFVGRLTPGQVILPQ